MQRTEEAVEALRLDGVRRRRRGLRRAMTELEEAASSALPGRPDAWRTTVLMRMDALQDAWVSHVDGTEGPAGLWEQIRDDEPRLDGRLRLLRREHVATTADITSLHRELTEADDDDELRLVDVRERVVALLVRLARHRQRGADLIYEAYQHDVGGAG